MKKIIAVMFAVMWFSACGGSTDTSEPVDVALTPDVNQPVEDVEEEQVENVTNDPLEGLPAIKDDYVDYVFVYESMGEYVGVYSLPDDPVFDGCSVATGNPSPAEIEVSTVSTTSLVTLTDGIVETFPYDNVDLYDMYSFTFGVNSVDCTLVLMSSNFEGQTTDSLAMYCYDNITSNNCYTEWQRKSEYDYMAYNVKSLDVDMPNNIEEMLREVSERK